MTKTPDFYMVRVTATGEFLINLFHTGGQRNLFFSKQAAIGAANEARRNGNQSPLCLVECFEEGEM